MSHEVEAYVGELADLRRIAEAAQGLLDAVEDASEEESKDDRDDVSCALDVLRAAVMAPAVRAVRAALSGAR